MFPACQLAASRKAASASIREQPDNQRVGLANESSGHWQVAASSTPGRKSKQQLGKLQPQIKKEQMEKVSMLIIW